MKTFTKLLKNKEKNKMFVQESLHIRRCVTCFTLLKSTALCSNFRIFLAPVFKVVNLIVTRDVLFPLFPS